MKVAIITSGLLPVPSVNGGAIETLIDSFIKENEKSQENIDLTIYSIYSKKAQAVVEKLHLKKTKFKYLHLLNNMPIRLINKIFKTNIANNYLFQKLTVFLVNKKHYDYIIVENYPELVLKLKSNKVIPYIHSDVFNLETKDGDKILNKCYKVFCVSDFIKNEVVKINKDMEYKLSTIRNSIDFNSKTKDETSILREKFRKKYNIKDDETVFLFSGRISKEKGVYEVAQAFTNLDNKNTKLIIIGGIWYGCNKKDEYLEKIINLKNENIIFTGYMDHQELEDFLYIGDVGIVPSLCNEAAGLSVVEFMNANMFVIATNKGGIKEYLNNDLNELISFANNEELVQKLEEKMKAYLENKKNIKKRLSENQEFARQFSPQENYKQIIANLKED